MYKIAFITDLHIPEDLKPKEGIPVYENFLWALETAGKYLPDLIIIGGDLCYDKGDITIMKLVKEQLDQTGIEYYVIPGNHDDSLMLAEVFNYTTEGNKIKPYNIFKEGFELSFLDSADYTVYLPHLQSALSSKSPQKIIFVHHPLTIGGNVFMDNYHKLYNHEENYAYLKSIDVNAYFFHGHYHTHYFSTFNKLKFFITPSTFYQIDPLSPTFMIASEKPAFNLIQLNNEGLSSTIIYR